MKLLTFILLLTSYVSFSQGNKLQLTIEFLKDFDIQLKDKSVSVSLRDFDKLRKGKSRFTDTTINNSCTIEFDKIVSGVARISLSANISNNDSTITRYFHDYYSINLRKDSGNVVTIIFPRDCDYNKHALDKECPKCKMSDKVLPIKYGLIRGNKYGMPGVDYLPGGCLVKDCDPSWYCKRDDARF